MTKYRLNIKYPIEKKDANFFCLLYDYDGFILTIEKLNKIPHDGICCVRFAGADNDGMFACLSSWVDEIEDNDFEKWSKKHPIPVNNSGWTKEDMELERTAGWQASQENRDLLYKELLNKSQMVMCYPNNDEIHDEFVTEYAKIRDFLKGNVQG